VIEYWPGTEGNRKTLDDGSGVAFDQGIGILGSYNFLGDRPTGGKIWDAAFCVVSVGSENVDGGAVEEPAGDDLGAFAPEAGERRGRDLHQAALLGPFQDALWCLLEDGIALGMGEDGGQSAISEAGETFRKPCRDTEVAEFNQQVVSPADRVGVRVLEHAFQILEGKMKVASQSQLQWGFGSDFLLEVSEKAGKIGAIVGVAIIGVWGGDGMGDAVRRGHAAHFDGYVPGFRAVIDFGQKMAVDVDHDGID